MLIALDKITPDPDQPRKIFDAAALQELADSIAENGLMQPITVRPAQKKGHYWVVAGERRYRASTLNFKRGGPDKIECLVSKPLDVADLRVKQIIENLQRRDLTPMEEARCFADLHQFGMGDDVAAKRLGISVAKYRQRLSLLRLDDQIIQLLESGNLGSPQALEIARLPEKSDQIKILRMLNRGEIGKWKSLKAAVDAILEGVTQVDMFGDSAPKASDEEVGTLTAMEARIEKIASMVALGFHKGECVIANKVSPDRAANMADRLAAIRMHIRHMEQELRAANAQVRIALGDKAA